MVDTVLLVTGSLIAGWGGALYMARHGLRLGFSDPPKQRSAHHTATPRGGGIGILVALVAVALLLRLPIVLPLAIAMVGLVSFADDRFGLSVKVRLSCHLSAAVLVAGGLWGQFNGVHDLLPFLFWVLFIAGTGNAWNFMDGINGMAGITGLIAFILLGVFALGFGGNGSLALLCLAAAAACLGFLPLNYPRARVFMGDVGSISLGFLFGSLVFTIYESFTGFLCMISLLLPFYLDTTLTLLSRIYKRSNIFLSHSEHLYQQLVKYLDLPQGLVSFLYGLIQLSSGLAMILLYGQPVMVSLFILINVVLFSVYVNFHNLQTP